MFDVISVTTTCSLSLSLCGSARICRNGKYAGTRCSVIKQVENKENSVSHCLLMSPCCRRFTGSLSVGRHVVARVLQGDLKTFLRATTNDNSCGEPPPAVSGRLPPLSVAQRITMCGQIALGMEHIADRGLTHRDLAARNVLLSPSLHLKVCVCVCRSSVVCRIVTVCHSNLSL